MKPYVPRDFCLPAEMVKGLHDYSTFGLQPGSFLTSVIMNDLAGAVASGSVENLRNLPAFVAYLYNEAPPECWGSREKVRAWVLKMWKARQLAQSGRL